MLRIGSYLKVWTVEQSKINGYLNCKCSASHKDSKEKSGYKTDFSDFVNIRARVGEIAPNAVIIPDDIAISTAYNKDTKKQYVNFYIERWHLYSKQSVVDANLFVSIPDSITDVFDNNSLIVSP